MVLPGRCQEAVEAFGRLPVRHYNTGWVLNQVGRALFELVDYPEAARSFQAARQLDPYRLKVGGASRSIDGVS